MEQMQRCMSSLWASYKIALKSWHTRFFMKIPIIWAQCASLVALCEIDPPFSTEYMLTLQLKQFVN